MAECNKPQLSLHIRLEDRKDLSGKDAVQGELFEPADRQEDFKVFLPVSWFKQFPLDSIFP